MQYSEVVEQIFAATVRYCFLLCIGMWTFFGFWHYQKKQGGVEKQLPRWWLDTIHPDTTWWPSIQLQYLHPIGLLVFNIKACYDFFFSLFLVTHQCLSVCVRCSVDQTMNQPSMTTAWPNSDWTCKSWTRDTGVPGRTQSSEWNAHTHTHTQNTS